MLPLIAALFLLQSHPRSFGEGYAGDRPAAPAPPTFAPEELAAPVKPAPDPDRPERTEVDLTRNKSNPPEPGPDPFPVSPFYESAVVGTEAWVVWWRDGLLNTLAAFRPAPAGGAAQAAQPGTRRVKIPGRPK